MASIIEIIPAKRVWRKAKNGLHKVENSSLTFEFRGNVVA